jgi:hypothetical protein
MATDRQLIKEYRSLGQELEYEGAQLAEYIERSIREYKDRQAAEREKDRQAQAAERERVRLAEERGKKDKRKQRNVKESLN